MKTAIVEGKEVKIGDFVGFKCDIEQDGEIKDIQGSGSSATLVLFNGDGFDGGYIGGHLKTSVLAKDCWID